MFLSVFDIFKIGVGPSSSHTMGPMVAAAMFLEDLRKGRGRIPGAGAPVKVSCRLHGSLAFTGKGHATDRAVILGLAGFEPATLDAEKAEAALATIASHKRVTPEGLDLAFDPDTGIVFDYGPALPEHANGMVLEAFDANGTQAHVERYFSIGGGFVLTGAQMAHPEKLDDPAAEAMIPYPFASAAQMLEMAERSGLSIAEMKRRNEETSTPRAELDKGIDRLLEVMDGCIERGLTHRGILPGGLNVRRRAPDIHRQLIEESGLNQPAPHIVNDWSRLVK